MPKTITKSSGILDNFSLQAPVVDVEIANLDPVHARTVLVQIFDWTGNFPVALPVISFNGPILILGGPGPIDIQGGTKAEFLADISKAFSYEVRITFFKTAKNVVATSQGIRKNGRNTVGQTVLAKDFKKVHLD